MSIWLKYHAFDDDRFYFLLSEWVIKFNRLFGTADIRVHVVYTSRVIIAYIDWVIIFPQSKKGIKKDKSDVWNVKIPSAA